MASLPGRFPVSPPSADASCNVIPGAERTFRGTLARIDRPYVGGGDWIALGLDPTCHASSPGFSPNPSAGAQVVTVVIKPLPGGPARVEVLATNCAAVESARAACESRADVATAVCHTVNLPGQPRGLDVPGVRDLRFRFPDTDAEVLLPGDDVGWAGPAAIAVTATGAPLPCALASSECSAVGGTLACVDRLFTDDGPACGAVANPVFPAFTALPPANDYQAICTNPASVCTGASNDIRFALDVAGNVLLPMSWRGVLIDRDSVPVARLLRGATTVDSFPGSGQAIRVPGLSFLASYSPEGWKLPPIFDPQVDPTDPVATTFFGTADAPATVLRLARRSSSFSACAGGANDGRPCNAAVECPGGACAAARCVAGPNAGIPCGADADCPASECGTGLFDFSSRTAVPAGPVVVRLGACIGGSNALTGCADDLDCPGGQCGDFSLEALDPVPLEGLNQSAEANAFVVSEALVDLDLNGDGDVIDDVAQLADRTTGVVQPIGVGGATGRAVVRILASPFTFPGLAVEGNLVAFLEPERAQFGQDRTGDLDVLDTILRIYRLGPGSATEVTAGVDRAVDPSPVIDDRSLAVSEGLVFVREREASAARWRTEVISKTPSGGPPNGVCFDPAASEDGRFVAFSCDASNVVAGDSNGARDVFVHDRELDTTERVSVTSAGAQANTGPSAYARISRDGRYVSFISDASDLVPGDTNNTTDAFLRDRQTGVTERVSVGPGGAQGNSYSTSSWVSGDGRYVAFESKASNLVAGDTNGAVDVFVRDRLLGVTERVNVSTGGSQALGSSGMATLSDDARFVGFQSLASNLVAGDTNGVSDAFVHDRLTGETLRLSTTPAGAQGDRGSSAPQFGPDPTLILFGSAATNLTPGDTNEAGDTFVLDRVANRLERNYLDRPGSPALGRWEGFAIAPQCWVQDRLTGISDVFSVSDAGVPGNGECRFGDVAKPLQVRRDGTFFAFQSGATNVVPGFTNLNVYVREIDSTDLAHDLSGDGDLDDTLLRAVDGTTGADVGPACPAGQASVAAGRAAFLRPESAGFAAGCPGPGAGLNGDGDTDDSVVHLWSAGTVANLGLAATRVALSSSHLAALVSESAQGGIDLNGDGDAGDLVAHVHAATGGAWTNTGRAADELVATGSVVAFVSPEDAEGMDLDGDGDLADRVVQIHRADTASTENLGQTGTGLVVGGTPGGEIVAFRSDEAAQGEDLNGDGDLLDEVLQVYDAASGRVLDSGFAVTPCRLAACDPRLPYKVQRDTVIFLTFEADQGADLNGDGDATDLVLQVFNVRLASASGGSRPGSSAPGFAPAADAAPTSVHALAAVGTGVCTSTGDACASDSECPGGTCFVPPGGCIHDLGAACNSNGGAGQCGAGNYCEPIAGSPGSGTCKTVAGPCAGADDCSPTDHCNMSDQDIQRLAAPLSAAGAGGPTFNGSGRCIEPLPGTTCATASDCSTGEFCDAGLCAREQGTCRTAADCAPDAVCRRDLIVATAADSDGDEIPDAFDGCPDAPDVLQADADGDGVGDACDPAECGNGLVEPGEDCESGACCTPTCHFATSATVCRASSGACDAAETCDGASAACPVDAVAPPGAVCRPAAGECDAAETCDGAGTTCPADALTPAGTGCASDGNPCTDDRCDGASATCGHLPNAAACDDGNACTVGDVCAAGTCQPGPGTVSCGSCEACDATSGCVVGPRAGCRAPTRAGASSLVLVDAAGGASAALSWTWTRGAATGQADFGSPADVNGTDYTVCLFSPQAPAPQLRTRLEISAGGLCAGRPCWRERPKGAGWIYTDRVGASDGVTSLQLRPGAAGKAKIVLRARGANLQSGAPPLGLPARIQLQASDGACWEATYSAAQRNLPGSFKARSE